MVDNKGLNFNRRMKRVISIANKVSLLVTLSFFLLAYPINCYRLSRQDDAMINEYSNLIQIGDLNSDGRLSPQELEYALSDNKLVYSPYQLLRMANEPRD